MGEAVRQGRWTAEIEGDFVVFLINGRPSWRLIRSLRDLGGRSVRSGAVPQRREPEADTQYRQDRRREPA